MPVEAGNAARAKSGRGRLFLIRLLAICLGFAAGLLVTELALHLQATWVHSRGRQAPPAYSSDAGEIRLAILGGSTSNGGPYSDAQGCLRLREASQDPAPAYFNLLSIVQFLLENHYGHSNVQVDAYTYGGWPVESAVKDYWQNAKFKPDILVLYTGHNEWTSYYSSNMAPPPRWLSPLGHLYTGSMLLRYLFTRQARDDDRYNYKGPFFVKETIPWYEAAHNKERFAGYVESLIWHCQSEGIFLIIVIPEGNYLQPPNRSIYHGPADKKSLALTLFKQACQSKYLDGDMDRAKAVLDKLNGFCSFADLDYELGDVYYGRGDFSKAREHLLKARDAAGIPTTVTSEYRGVLQELVDKYDVPSIDMNELIMKGLGASAADFSVFLDECHLRPHVYAELSHRIIRVLRERNCPGLHLPDEDFKFEDQPWQAEVGLTDEVVAIGSVMSNQFIKRQAGDTFLKLPSLEKCLEYFPEVRPDLLWPSEVAAKHFAELKREIETEREKLLAWRLQ